MTEKEKKEGRPKKGRKLRPRKIKTLLERFENMYTPEPNTGCWLWLGASTQNGYGTIRLGRAVHGSDFAHRVAYELFIGPIPKNMQIDHKCRVRCCVNPNHLESVTCRENVTRGLSGVLFPGKASKYVGVGYKKKNSRWYATIRVNGEPRHLGYFAEEEDAAAAYQKALRELNDKKE